MEIAENAGENHDWLCQDAFKGLQNAGGALGLPPSSDPVNLLWQPKNLWILKNPLQLLHFSFKYIDLSDNLPQPLSRSIPTESFIFVWILPQHHLYSICVCDPSICLRIRRNHIIAQCLCSCLSLANLHLPSSAQEATFLCLLPFRFNIFFGFCFIFFRLSFSAAFVGVKEDIYGKKIPLFLRLESRDLLLMCFTLNITVSAFL